AVDLGIVVIAVDLGVEAVTIGVGNDLHPFSAAEGREGGERRAEQKSSEGPQDTAMIASVGGALVHPHATAALRRGSVASARRRRGGRKKRMSRRRSSRRWVAIFNHSGSIERAPRRTNLPTAGRNASTTSTPNVRWKSARETASPSRRQRAR